MQRWLVKTEPSSYSFRRLQEEGRTTWDGVKNPVALKHLACMRTGDRVVVYHTGAEKAAVGFARVTKGSYPDPTKTDPRLVVVDLAAGEPLARPVRLAELRGQAAFRDSPLLRVPRLSVMPLSAVQWAALEALART
jgi:predicted RNA-binding protein with PUA-like domain